MLVITTLVAYGATLFSGFLSYFTGVTLFPSMIAPGAPIEQISEAHDISPFFTVGLSLIHICVAPFFISIGHIASIVDSFPI